MATSQALPHEDEQAMRRVGSSITAMLFDALVLRTAVPATLHLVNVAPGRIDAFWQFIGAVRTSRPRCCWSAGSRGGPQRRRYSARPATRCAISGWGDFVAAVFFDVRFWKRSPP